MAVADYLQSPARGMCPHMPCLQRGGHQRHHHQYWVSTPLCSAALPGYVICGLVLVGFFFFPTTYIIPNKNNLEIIVCKTKLLKSDQVTQCMLASQTHQQYCPQQTWGNGTWDKSSWVKTVSSSDSRYCFMNKTIFGLFASRLVLLFLFRGLGLWWGGYIYLFIWLGFLFWLGFVYTYELENLLLIIA